MSTGTANKLTTLEKAIQAHVSSGAHLSIGGFTINRNPMAAVHEIIRQGVRNLHVYAHSNGQGVDELIGAGCVSKLEIAYSGNGRFAPTCICFKRAVLDKTLGVEDYTNFQMALRFMAGAMGVPFLPTYSSLGTDIIEKWGFVPEERQADSRLPDKKLVVMNNPFAPPEQTDPLVLVPAIQPDVTLIHAQMADPAGCARIEGLTFADIDQVKAARHVIVTCEQVMDSDVMRRDSAANHLPGFCVDAVVHVPFGAYPTACFNVHDYDALFLDQYRAAARTNDSMARFFDDYIFGTQTHDQFVEKAAGSRLDEIRASHDTGYAEQMRRG